MEYIEGRTQIENLISLSDFIESKCFEVNKLFKPSNQELFVVKAYARVLNEITKTEKDALEESLERSIRRVKNTSREMKINSLKQRSELQKKEILRYAESRIQNYKILLKDNINILRNTEKDKIFFVYRENDSKDVVCAIPAKIEILDGDIHMKRDEEREIIANDNYLKIEKDKKLLLANLENILNNELKEKIQVKIEKIDILNSNTFADKYGSESRIMNFDLNIIKFSEENIDAVLNTNKDYKIYSKNISEDMERYILSGYKKNKKICLVLNEDIDKFEYLKNLALNRSMRSKEKFFDLQFRIKKNARLDEVEYDGESLREIYHKSIQNENFKFEDYQKYKKYINLDGLTYKELEELLKDIKVRDIEIFKNYKNIKMDKNYKDEIFCTLKEGENLIILLQKLKRKISYADIIKSDEYQRIILELYKKNDILSRQELIAVSKAYANKIVKNNSKWSLKNIFVPKDDKTEEDGITRTKKVMEVYNIFAKELEEIKLLNQNIFIKVIEALRSTNMNASINIIVSDLRMKLEVLKFLEEINTWHSEKYALIEFISESPNVLEEKSKFLIFKKVYDFERVCNQNKIEIEVFKDDNKQLQSDYNETLNYISKSLDEEKFLEIINKNDFEKMRELTYEKYDIVITNKFDSNESERYTPYAFEGKKVLSFVEK